MVLMVIRCHAPAHSVGASSFIVLNIRIIVLIRTQGFDVQASTQRNRELIEPRLVEAKVKSVDLALGKRFLERGVA